MISHKVDAIIAFFRAYWVVKKVPDQLLVYRIGDLASEGSECLQIDSKWFWLSRINLQMSNIIQNSTGSGGFLP